ncbi:NAD(P)-dependent alcohol dehydrogenase [Candidatus Thiosymbion oneisti]|uniref:NAD(P)-dependent alcohol dehydrogenase n=1 Tax=Candidatus Thiosymbion oneisti TaxID=589554 RepID=UPI000B7CE6B0|nr:NAD(P)-dependent alcohol dehydrogenase [Candidatus Thiosymbion oneisti]
MSETMFQAYASLEPGGRLQDWEYEPAPLGKEEVEIRITHNGLCHTDIHMRDNDWGISTYPLVPGHEVVGVVTQTGKDITSLAVGDRVGFGWIRDACRQCDHCIQGEENICHNGYTGLILGHHGGFADKLRAPADFAYKIPDRLDSAAAAPLLCAGITVYTPLRTYVTRPAMKVGVIGIGGLGHIAVKYAKAMGAEVTVFSTSPDKEAETKEFGAHHFQIWENADEMKKAHSSQDLIINTAPAATDFETALNLLGNNGTLCIVGLPTCSVEVPVTSLVFGQKAVVGSVVGGRRFMREMLNFSAVHNITPMVETMPLSQVNEAMDKVAANKARYRIVLTA